MTEWMDIETAPKDGTRMILLVKNYAIEAHYDNERYYESKWDVVRLPVHGCSCSYENGGRFPLDAITGARIMFKKTFEKDEGKK